MKILLAGFAKIKYMPYVNFYLDNIDREKHEVHLVYWNRDLAEEDLSKYEGSNCTSSDIFRRTTSHTAPRSEAS